MFRVPVLIWKRKTNKLVNSCRSIRWYNTSSIQWYNTSSSDNKKQEEPGSKAFSESEKEAVMDLFNHYANKKKCGGMDAKGKYLTIEGVNRVLTTIGEQPNEKTIEGIFKEIDLNQDNKLHLNEFMLASDTVLACAPARVVLVVGGPGSGKGLLCSRLAKECNVIHLSCGDMLRDEVAKKTPLGIEVDDIMKRGDLVSSEVITSLLRRRMRNYPQRRILLDGFPRSLQNAIDFKEICGKPELALHLECDDTVLLERIIKRSEIEDRIDDSVQIALKRLRTFRKYHNITMEWLRQERIPLVNLDCSGTPDNVWHQLEAIGRLMRPVTKI